MPSPIFGYRPEQEGWGWLCTPNPCWSWAVSSWRSRLALGRSSLPAAGGSGAGWGGALPWKCHLQNTLPPGLEGLQKEEPSVVWHFRCAAELQISLPSQECGCTALAKLGQKCLNKEEREESKGRKWKCSVSASERYVGTDSSVTRYREETELITTLTFKEALSSFCSPKFSLLSDTSTPFLSTCSLFPEITLVLPGCHCSLAEHSWNCQVPESQGQAITMLMWI